MGSRVFALSSSPFSLVALARSGNPQLPADSHGGVLCDLGVPRNRGSVVVCRVLPDGVVTTLAGRIYSRTRVNAARDPVASSRISPSYF